MLLNLFRRFWNIHSRQARSQGGGAAGAAAPPPPPPGGQEGPFRRAQRAEKGRRDRAKRSF